MLVNCPSCKTSVEVTFDRGAEDETLNAEDGTVVIDCPKCGEIEIPGNINETILAKDPEVFGNEKLAHFSLLRLLGQGGFGTVWLAEDSKLGRQVALKVPVSSDGNVKSLLHEAKTAARLKHPHIVSVYEVGLEEGQVYIASEFIDGMTLRDLLTTGKQKISRTVELLIAIAEALQHAHTHDVIHRDIKPANIIINKEGEPFVTDFGLAKKISADASISSEGQVLGTAKYMSPEQASGKTRETDHRTDIYALGVILFEMLTTHPPFRGNVRAILHQKIFDEAPSPGTLDPTIPKDLETICMKCLDRDPDKRYQQAQDFADELKRFQAGEPILARPISTVEKVWRWCRRRPGVATLLASLFLSLTCGLLGVSYFWIEAEASANISNRMFYRSQMKLALQYLALGDPIALKETLFPFEDGQSLADLKGFEWDYYDTRADIFQQIVSINEPVVDVAISGKGDLFAGCSASKELIVWDTKTGEEVNTLKLASGEFTTLSFSPNSDILATGSSDGELRLWNPRVTDHPILQDKHGPRVKLIRFSPDGKLLASGGKNGALRVRDSKTLELVSEIPIGMTELVDFRFSPDSTQIAIGTNNDIITIWKVDSRERLLRSPPIPLLSQIVFSEDSQSLIAGTDPGELVKLELESNQLKYLTASRLGIVGDIEFSKSPKRLLIARQTGHLFVYDPERFTETNRLSTHVLSFGTLDRSRNGKLIVTGSGDGTIKILKMDRLALPDVLWSDSHIRQVEVINQGEAIATLVGDKRVDIQQLNQVVPETVPLHSIGERLTSMSAQTDGQLLAIAGSEATVLIWDLVKHEVIAELDTESAGTTDVLFSKTGKYLAVINRSGKVWLYNSEKFETPYLDWKTEGLKVAAFCFHPEEDVFVTAFEDGQIEFFDLKQDGKRTRSLQTEKNPRAICFCNSGESLVIGTNSGRIHIWDSDEPRKFRTIKAHAARINDIVSFPDEKRFATASRDQQIKIWDLESADQITSLRGHQTQIFSLALTPDGSQLISAGLSGDIRIWRGK